MQFIGFLTEYRQTPHKGELEKHQAEIDRLNTDLSSIRADRDQAKEATADAKEAAAKLSGQLEAIQAQNSSLMEKLTPQKAVKKSNKD